MTEAKHVYTKESSLEKQVFIGPFLGPFFALLTMAVALFYYSPEHMELPLAGLVGIYCSWKWRLRGAAIAWVILAAVTSFKSLSSFEPSIWWNISLSTSIALACLITALTQRNVRDHLEWKYQDSVEQQSRLAIAEARLNTILQTVNQERQEAQQIADNLRAQLMEKTTLLESQMQYIDVSRAEIIHTRSENEGLQKEIFEIRQKALRNQEDLETAKETLETLQGYQETSHKQEKEIRELRHTLDAFQYQIASYKDDLHHARQQQTLIKEMGDLIETITREKSLLENTLGSLQAEIEVLKSKDANECITVTEESPQELRRLEGFYRQLRDQFEEKSKTLDETRRELFCTQEKLSAIEIDFSEKELVNPQISLEEHERHLAKIEGELRQELEINQQEIKNLYDLIDTIIKNKA